MKIKIYLGLISVALMCAVSFSVYASIGVGVGVGKIQVAEPLKPGITYDLPEMSVINTGDEPSDYHVVIEYHEGQLFKPEKDWVVFEPDGFRLEPGQVQLVDMSVNLPIKTPPGDYFAYLSAQPVQKSAGAGNTSIGIAAATKLYFTVVPANIFVGIYYKVASFFRVYYPWPLVVLGMIFAAALILLFKKYFKFSIARKEPEKVAVPEQKPEQPIPPQEPKV